MENKFCNIKFCDIINGYLENLLKYNENSGLPRVIFEAMRYGVLGDGKRMRPTLLLAVCDMLSGDIRYALPYAAAVELIHAYSLIHDDLPAMDNDDFRRGQPSCHKKFGEAIAILAGDALLSLAFEHMLDSMQDNTSSEKLSIPEKVFELIETSFFVNSSKPPELQSRIRACRDIANASGFCGMVGGQALEFASASRKLSSNDILAIHKLKTGALISVSVLTGARLADADSKTIHTISMIGEKFGTAFQIMDDLHDAPGDDVNFAMTAGFEHATGLCTVLKTEIDELLAGLNLEKKFFRQYVNMILAGDV